MQNQNLASLRSQRSTVTNPFDKSRTEEHSQSNSVANEALPSPPKKVQDDAISPQIWQEHTFQKKDRHIQELKALSNVEARNHGMES